MKSNSQPTKNSTSLRRSARIIWAIVAKDMVEALKNKNTISIIVISLFMSVFYYYLPILSTRGEPPRVRIYDEGESALVQLMETSGSLNVRTYPSLDIVITALRNNDVPTLGLVIPGDFDLALEENKEVALQGYVLSWVSSSDSAELRQSIENEIARLLGIPVSIRMDGNQFGLAPDSHGIGTTAALAIVFVVTMIGLLTIPHLMLEEKKTHTMDVLLVSPASAGHLVAGKAIVGLFYCLLGAIITLVIFQFVVIHWWLALLTIVIGALFTVSLGLWLGTIIESRAQLTMLSWVFFLPLLLPMVLSLMEELLPSLVVQILQLVPTTVMSDLLRASFSSEIPLDTTLFRLAYLAAWAGALLLFVTWLVRRQDRLVERESTTGYLAEESAFTILESGARLVTQFYQRISSAVKTQSAEHSESTKTTSGLDRTKRNQNIIWIIAWKDITGSLKNRLILSIILGTIILVASGALPRMLIIGRSDPAAIVYDPGRSAILRSLASSDQIQIGFAVSLEEMQKIVSEAPEILIGLSIPEDFDDRAGNGQTIELEGYAVHWADSRKVDERVAFFQERIGEASNNTIRINFSEQRLYPPPVLEGQSMMFVMLVSVVLLTMGFSLVPLLLVEEKIAHTLEVLLVSPARIYQIAAGKALAGGFYCLVAMVVVFFLNRFLVVNWGVTMLAVLLGGAFAVIVGLLVGVLSDNATSVGMWAAVLIIGLFGITVLGALPNLNLSPVIQSLLGLSPTAAMAKLLGFSLAAEFPVSQMWANVAALLTAVLLAFGLLSWRLKLTDR